MVRVTAKEERDFQRAANMLAARLGVRPPSLGPFLRMLANQTVAHVLHGRTGVTSAVIDSLLEGLDEPEDPTDAHTEDPSPVDSGDAPADVEAA